MVVTLEKLSPVRHCIVVEVPAGTHESAHKKALQMIKAEAELPGFRKGKVPDSMLLQKFGKEIEKETIRKIVRLTYPDAVKELNIHPLSDPEIEPVGKPIAGAPYKYKAHIELYPEVEAKGYEGLELEREKVEVTDKEVEAELLHLQRQMTQLEPAEGAEMGPDIVALIDFKGTAGGKPFHGSEAKDYIVEFGAGSVLKDFEVQIKGMKANEERKVEFHYPAGYFKKEIAGKKGEFNVKVKELRRKVVPEFGDDFAKDLGNFAAMSDVRKDVEKRIGEYKEMLVKSALKEQAVGKLIEKHKELDVPMALIDAELGNMLNQLVRRLESQGQTLEQAKVDPKEFVRANVELATKRARGYMLIKAIWENEGITATDEEVDKRIADIATARRDNKDKVLERYAKQENKERLRSEIIFDKTLNFLIEKAKIKTKKPKKESK